MQRFNIDLEKQLQIDIDQKYLVYASITVFITLITLVAFGSITRLLIFHIKLG
jgi:hypothetical protein